MNKLIIKAGIISVMGMELLSNKIKLDKSHKYSKTYESFISVDDKIIEYDRTKMIIDAYEYITKYAAIYEMEPGTIYNKVREITNDFDIYYNNKFIIEGVEYDKLDLATLSVVRNIYYNKEQYGLTDEDVAYRSYETYDYCEELVEKYSDILDINKEIAMTICYVECGANLDSNNFIENHNVAGLGPYNHYLNLEQGVIEYTFILKNSFGCTKDSDSSFFYQVGSAYCGSTPDHWIGLANGFYYNVVEDYYYYAYNRGYEKVLN